MLSPVKRQKEKTLVGLIPIVEVLVHVQGVALA